MLKKVAMATKVAKLMLAHAVRDSKDQVLKDNVLNVLEKVYIAGYDLAVKECKDDNSNAGYTMAEHLENLEESDTKYV